MYRADVTRPGGSMMTSLGVSVVRYVHYGRSTIIFTTVRDLLISLGLAAESRTNFLQTYYVNIVLYQEGFKAGQDHTLEANQNYTLGDGLFLETARHVSKDYPEILHDDITKDNCCMQLISNPHQFDIINTMNLYGSIISHIVSGLSGGAGLFAGRNYGDNYAVFEPVTRSTGSTISGNNVANPVAYLNASVDILHHLGHCEHAECIRKAIITTLNQDKLLTPG